MTLFFKLPIFIFIYSAESSNGSTEECRNGTSEGGLNDSDAEVESTSMVSLNISLDQ